MHTATKGRNAASCDYVVMAVYTADVYWSGAVSAHAADRQAG